MADGRQAWAAQHRASVIVALAGVLIGLVWALATWRYGADLSDEGFYWYGAQRVLAGEVPIRDFMAYDVARYYWAAAVMGLLGSDGLPAARAAAWLFYLPALALAGLMVQRALSDRERHSLRWLWIATAVALCCAWVVMHYKTYDQFASLVVTALGIWVMRNGSGRSFLVSGVLVGLLSTLGRNHGVYGAATLILAALVLGARQRDFPFALRACTAVCVGALLGFIPTLAMGLWVPGFAAAFLDSVLELFRLGSTNVALPIPWPWTLDVAGLGFVTGLRKVTPGLLFLMLMLPVGAALFLFASPAAWTPTQRVLIGIGLAAAPYIHYALSRADIEHLSFAIPPLVIFCCVVAGQGAWGRITLATLVVLSGIALYETQPYLKRSGLAEVRIDGQVFHARAGFKDQVMLLKEAQASAAARGPLLAVPNLIGLHAMERLAFPGWEIYPLVPRKPEVVEAQLARLRSQPPAVVLWSDHALDGNEDLRLSRLNPRLFAWVVGHCREVLPRRPVKEVKVYVNCVA